MCNKLDNDGIIITLGNDVNNKYAWAISKVNNITSICIFNKTEDGLCTFDDTSFITSIPLQTIVKNTNKYVLTGEYSKYFNGK